MFASLINAEHNLKEQITTVHLRTSPELIKTLDSILVSHSQLLILGTKTTEEIITYSRTYVTDHTSPNPQAYTTLVTLISDLLSIESPTNRCIRCNEEHCESSDMCEGCTLELEHENRSCT